jgi:hypothetical protein
MNGLSRKDLHTMQAAAQTPGVDYSVFVSEMDDGHVVTVAFTGLIDKDHADLFAKYITILLELNSIDSTTELPN